VQTSVYTQVLGCINIQSLAALKLASQTEVESVTSKVLPIPKTSPNENRGKLLNPLGMWESASLYTKLRRPGGLVPVIACYDSSYDNKPR